MENDKKYTTFSVIGHWKPHKNCLSLCYNLLLIVSTHAQRRIGDGRKNKDGYGRRREST